MLIKTLQTYLKHKKKLVRKKINLIIHKLIRGISKSSTIQQRKKCLRILSQVRTTLISLTESDTCIDTLFVLCTYKKKIIIDNQKGRSDIFVIKQITNSKIKTISKLLSILFIYNFHEEP